MSNSGKKTGNKAPIAWRTYQDVANYVVGQLMEQFEIDEVEGTQILPGKKSGTKWEIDGKAIRQSDGSILIIEARRYPKSRLGQEDVSAIAYKIEDMDAAGAIIVSPLSLQSGAQLVATAENIRHLRLDPNSTRDHWVAQIEGALFAGIVDSISVGLGESIHIRKFDVDGNLVEEVWSGYHKTGA